jgi:transcriptional regulator with XRE-family HTH domain
MPKRAEPTGFGSRLKELREAAGLTQDALAERARLNKFSVAKLEQGVREPTWATALTLAKALGVGVAAFAAVEELAPAEEGPAQAASAASGDEEADAGRGNGAEPPKKRGRPPRSPGGHSG